MVKNLRLQKQHIFARSLCWQACHGSQNKQTNKQEPTTKKKHSATKQNPNHPPPSQTQQTIQKFLFEIPLSSEVNS